MASIRKSPGTGTGTPISSTRIRTNPATTPWWSRNVCRARRISSHHSTAELLLGAQRQRLCQASLQQLDTHVVGALDEGDAHAGANRARLDAERRAPPL